MHLSLRRYSEDRKTWLAARLQRAGLSKETADAMAEGRIGDVMKGGKLSVDELAQREKREQALRDAERAESEATSNDANEMLKVRQCRLTSG